MAGKPGTPEPVWIETEHVADENRTEWRVVGDGHVKYQGSVNEDPSGTRAYESAQHWATDHRHPVLGWKHAVDRALSEPGRTRTTTARHVGLRLFGWARCATGAREAIAVTPGQLKELELGALPCPVCGEACGVTLVPTNEVKAIARTWTGSRWHHAARG